MTTPAIQFAPRFNGPDPITSLDADALPLIPTSGPLSAGEAPIAPALVRHLTIGEDVRSVRCVSGHAVTARMGMRPRPRCTVEWRSLTRAERDSLLAFLAGAGDVNHGEFAFSIRPDGAGTATVISVRPLSGYSETQQSHGGNGNPETHGVFDVSLECEEV